MNYKFSFLSFTLIIFFTGPLYSLKLDQQSQTVDLLARMNNGQVQFVDFVFSDISGNLKEVTRPVSYAEDTLRDGINFDGSSIPGCMAITESDMLLKPDINTYSELPWTTQRVRTARVICDIYREENEPYEGDPRVVLQKTIQEAHDMGYEFFVGPELEFFVFDKQEKKPSDSKKYFDAETNIRNAEFQKTLLYALRAQNVKVEKLHHEVASGQLEVSIQYDDALAIADQVIIAKHTIRSLAQEVGLHATFMPKPIFGENGSAMHVHFSLYDTKNKCNAFYDKQDPVRLSTTAKHFIAGVLNRVRVMTALFNPTINSYKRLVPGYEAPIYICWGTKNRSALVRIPRINKDQAGAARAEIRSPDTMSNPYLVFAAILKAGLEGIKNKEEVMPIVEDNLYHLRSEDLHTRNILSLPTSLDEALNLLQESAFIIDLLGTNCLSEFLALKEKELYSYKTKITDWEFEKYY